MIDRRSLILGTGATLAAGARAASAQQSGGARFSALRTDTNPLAANGGGFVGLIQSLMPTKMQDVFGDLVSPGARGLPVLVARIETLYLSGYADTNPTFAYSLQQDTMSGAGVVVMGRSVVSSTPLHVNLPPSYSGTWYLPDIDQRRVDSICYQFAYWLRREMQL